MSDHRKCDCCERDLSFRWSDHHGIGCCSSCGLPYVIYHYDENKKRVEKPPECALNGKGLEIARRYWSERKRRVFPAMYDMGAPRVGESYSGATADDIRAFDAWADTQPEYAKEVAKDQTA